MAIAGEIPSSPGTVTRGRPGCPRCPGCDNTCSASGSPAMNTMKRDAWPSTVPQVSTEMDPANDVGSAGVAGFNGRIRVPGWQVP